MKRVLLFIMLSASFLMSDAQCKADLKDYVGRYVFPEGSLAEDAVISIVNDTILNISASIGECELEHVEGETFSLPQYGGTIIFNRNTEKEVEGFKVSIPMAGIDSLEAHKDSKTIEKEDTTVAVAESFDSSLLLVRADKISAKNNR